MRKLLWLIPAVCFIPCLASIVHAYQWFFTGTGFLGEFNAGQAGVAWLSMVLGLVSATAVSTR